MRLLLLIVAAIIAIFAGVAALQLAAGGQEEARTTTPNNATHSNGEIATVNILVARQYIPAGSLITDNMIERQPWPRNLVLDGFIVSDDNNNAIGKVTRGSFQAHEPLLITKLASADDPNFLAANLPEHMRAITISIDAISGVAGYIFPGDRIDLLFTHSIPDQGSKAAAPAMPALGGMMGLGALGGALGGGLSAGGASVAEILANNVTVLAVNVRGADSDESGLSVANLIPNPQSMIAAAAGGGEGAPTNLTLQVTDSQAQAIRLAERTGNISVALRSIHDRNNTEIALPTTIKNLTQLSGGSANIGGNDEVKIYRAGQNNNPMPPMGGMMSMMR